MANQTYTIQYIPSCEYLMVNEYTDVSRNHYFNELEPIIKSIIDEGNLSLYAIRANIFDSKPQSEVDITTLIFSMIDLENI